MNAIVQSWFEEFFGNKQALTLVMINLLILLTLYFFSGIFSPVIISLVLAFMLQTPINKIAQYTGYKRATVITFSLFISIVSVSLMVVIPLLWQQCMMLADELPSIFSSFKKAVEVHIFSHIDILSPQLIDQMLSSVQQDITYFSKNIVQYSVSSIPSLIVLTVYAVLVPLIMFFFNLDKDKMSSYFQGFLPQDSSQLAVIFYEILLQFSNYIRGKIYEILIIGLSSYIVFWLLSLKYSFLLGTLVGLSVLIPYVGAALVTIPVVSVAYFQWGFDSSFSYVVIAYTIIQVLDGNVLVPLLFSEAVSLHPLAIIIAVLFFGSLGGIWGVFFAIPLAAVINTYLNHWPKTSKI